ncbi:MAG TPA: hypothetical protein VMG12_08080 [Polyangiaceae bacterium]|nr:hypothetical protein [Polyangiaceae bacterium]
MSDEHHRQRQALLDELRRQHRAEPAPEALRRRLLERAERGEEGFRAVPREQRLDWRSLSRWFGGVERPRVALGAVAALGVAVALRWGWSASLSERAGTIASAPELAVGPEPRGAPAPHAEPAAPSLSTDESGVLARGMSVRMQPCPLTELPPGAVIMPQKLGAPGLMVSTFEQQTLSCGPITRRYLQQRLPVLPKRTHAPVLILLHDAGESAELMFAREGFDYERIARESGALLIYANAAPGAATNPSVANSGSWHTDPRTSLQVDDEDYLRGIIADLTVQHVIDGENDVYLIGYGEGGAMALQAAARRAGYPGVAAFSPSNRASIEPSPERIGGRLTRVMLVLDSSSPWRTGMPRVARRWASALGLQPKVVGRVRKFGDAEEPLGVLQQLDASLPATGSPGVRLYLVAGAVERPPTARLAWEFLTGADGAQTPDDLPELAIDPELSDELVFDPAVVTAPR